MTLPSAFAAASRLSDSSSQGASSRTSSLGCVLSAVFLSVAFFFFVRVLVSLTRAFCSSSCFCASPLAEAEKEAIFDCRSKILHNPALSVCEDSFSLVQTIFWREKKILRRGPTNEGRHKGIGGSDFGKVKKSLFAILTPAKKACYWSLTACNDA